MQFEQNKKRITSCLTTNTKMLSRINTKVEGNKLKKKKFNYRHYRRRIVAIKVLVAFILRKRAN